MEELLLGESTREALIVVLDRVSDEELAVLYVRVCSVCSPRCVRAGVWERSKAMSYGKVCVISSALGLVEATRAVPLSTPV